MRSSVFAKGLREAGLAETNIERLDKALNEVHSALSRMDLSQLRAFKKTAMGLHCEALAEQYGRTRCQTLRSRF